MKVTGAGRQVDKRIITSSPSEEKRASDTIHASFREHIIKEEGKNCEERIVMLMDEINKQGEKLCKKADIKELRHYRKLVSDFLEEAVNSSHKFAKENYLDKRGRHKVYAVIKKINKKIENLTTEVLKEQKDNLIILQKLDDIRGLLLDLML